MEKLSALTRISTMTSFTSATNWSPSFQSHFGQTQTRSHYQSQSSMLSLRSHQPDPRERSLICSLSGLQILKLRLMKRNSKKRIKMVKINKRRNQRWLRTRPDGFSNLNNLKNFTSSSSQLRLETLTKSSNSRLLAHTSHSTWTCMQSASSQPLVKTTRMCSCLVKRLDQLLSQRASCLRHSLSAKTASTSDHSLLKRTQKRELRMQ